MDPARQAFGLPEDAEPVRELDTAAFLGTHAQGREVDAPLWPVGGPWADEGLPVPGLGAGESTLDVFRLDDPDPGDDNPPPPELDEPRRRGDQGTDDERSWMGDASLDPDVLAVYLGPACDPPPPWDDCADLLDIGPPRSVEDLRPSRDGLTIETGPFGAEKPTCEESLVAQMWGVLQDNLDLVEWAMCMAAPWVDEEQRECLRETLQNGPVTIRFKPGPCNTKNGGSWGMRSGGQAITICRDDSPTTPFSTSAFLYCECSAAGAQLCGVLSQAATLLHEVSHSCDWQHTKRERDRLGITRQCQEVFLLQQSFAYALFQRYPEAAASGCCDPYATTVPGDGLPLGQATVSCPCLPSGGG